MLIDWEESKICHWLVFHFVVLRAVYNRRTVPSKSKHFPTPRQSSHHRDICMDEHLIAPRPIVPMIFHANMCRRKSRVSVYPSISPPYPFLSQLGDAGNSFGDPSGLPARN